MSSPLSFRVFNSFTTTPFSGNPGAVYVFSPSDSRSDDAELMLKIAREHNLSETGFVVPRPSDDPAVPVYGLRWFTPTVEFPLCGHVTLGSAHVLFEEHHREAKRLQFETLSGTLFASRLDDGRIELDFPADVSVVEEIEVELEEDVVDKLVLVNAALAAAVLRVKRGKIGWIIELKEDFDLETAVLTVAPLVRSPLLPRLQSNRADPFLPRIQRVFDGYFIFTHPGGKQHPDHDIYSRVFDQVEPNPEDSVVRLFPVLPSFLTSLLTPFASIDRIRSLHARPLLALHRSPSSRRQRQRPQDQNPPSASRRKGTTRRAGSAVGCGELEGEAERECGDGDGGDIADLREGAKEKGAGASFSLSSSFPPEADVSVLSIPKTNIQHRLEDSTSVCASPARRKAVLR